MFKIKNSNKKQLAGILGIIFGGILFIFLITVFNNNTLLNKDYHMSLYGKHNVYLNIYNGMNKFLDERILSEEELAKRSVFSYAKKSLTEEVVRYNVNNFTDGLFKYFDGEKDSLPDIYLKLDSKETEENVDLTEIESLEDIFENMISTDKISFEQALNYIDGEKINDNIEKAKSGYKIFNNIPKSVVVYLIIILLLVVFLLKYLDKFIYFIKISLIPLSMLSFLFALIIYIFSNDFIMEFIMTSSTIEQLDSDFIFEYFSEILYDYRIFCIKIGALSLCLFITLTLLNKFTKLNKIKISPIELIKYEKLKAVFLSLVVAILIIIGLVISILNLNNFIN
ncbi:MAG: hypothetical protein ABF289_07680 [Clostridiales bacterium]